MRRTALVVSASAVVGLALAATLGRARTFDECVCGSWRTSREFGVFVGSDPIATVGLEGVVAESEIHRDRLAGWGHEHHWRTQRRTVRTMISHFAHESPAAAQSGASTW